MEDNLYDDKLAGLIDGQRYAQKLDELHDELAVLRSRLVNLEATETKKPEAEKPNSIRELYLGESKTGKRAIIHGLFDMRMRDGGVDFSLRTQ
jgi:hypothetical protein